MKITQMQLRQIIKEELVREFYDGSGDDRWEDEPSGPSGDQYELMTSLNMKSVAQSMINAWGSEDILVMVDILTSDDPASRGQFPPDEEDDLAHRAVRLGERVRVRDVAEGEGAARRDADDAGRRFAKKRRRDDGGDDDGDGRDRRHRHGGGGSSGGRSSRHHRHHD